MADFQHKPGTGSAFKNDYKTEDRHPDYKGKINIDGRTLDLAVWTRTGNKGTFLSVKVSEPFVKAEEQTEGPF